ncbi:MAG: hypothetical protein JWQ40_4421 [Segetibacter sp.]|jgi:hypothetical protein|nr:hypothetical protein [Segetibacter sp.]
MVKNLAAGTKHLMMYLLPGVKMYSAYCLQTISALLARTSLAILEYLILVGLDVAYEDWHGHKLDRKFLDLLRKN